MNQTELLKVSLECLKIAVEISTRENTTNSDWIAAKHTWLYNMVTDKVLNAEVQAQTPGESGKEWRKGKSRGASQA